MNFFRRLRVVPLLILVAFSAFIVRAGDFYYGLRHMGAAYAQEETAALPPPLPVEAQAGADQNGTDQNRANDPAAAPATQQQAMLDPAPASASAQGAVSGQAGPGGDDVDLDKWIRAEQADRAYSKVQTDMYEDLVARREALDKREQQLSVKEALLTAAQQELTQKTKELTAIRAEIEALVKKRDEQSSERVQSLVKIYEGMKAKDAARIFNTLDMDVLVGVLTHMSERKSAPILAEMDPDRARTVTLILAQDYQLPNLTGH